MDQPDSQTIRIEDYLPNQCLKQLYKQKWYDENAYAQTGNDMISLYKMMTDNMTDLQMHWIRAIIKNKFAVTQYQVTAVDSATKSKQFQYGTQAMIGLRCSGYHNFHRDAVNQEYLRWKKNKNKIRQHQKQFEFECPNEGCKKKNRIQDLHVDALIVSFFEFLNKTSNITIYFYKKPLITYKTSQKKQIPKWIQFLQSVSKNKQQLVTILYQGQQQKQFFDYYQTFITGQVDIKIAEDLSKLSDRNGQAQYFSKIQDTVKTNIFCFAQKKRIFNPLFHKDCKHYEQQKLLAMFSFDFVYQQIAKNLQVSCFFPGCSNKFTKQNFFACRVLSSQFRKQFYRQKMFYLLGQYQKHIYNDNHLRQKIIKRIDKYFATDLSKGAAAKENYKILLNDCQLRIQGLIKSVSTNRKKQQALYKKICERYKKQPKQNSRFVQFYYDDQKSISPCTFVQCKKCIKLLKQDNYLTNKYVVMDAWQIICRHLFLNQQKFKSYFCRNCRQPIEATKGLAEYLFLDLRVNKFFYIEGVKTRTFFYDCEKDQFVCKLDEYNGIQIRKKVMAYNSQEQIKVPKNFYYDYLPQPQPRLSRNKYYSAFCHIACLQLQKQVNHNYFVFIPDDQKPQKGLKCPECNAALFVTNLYYNDQLTRRLKKFGHGNRINPQRKGQFYSQMEQHQYQDAIFKDGKIALQYKNLRQKCFAYEQDHHLYSLNMSGNLFKQPIVLPCENHSLETRIIDFEDLKLFEQEQKDYVQCRNKNCQKIYKKKQQLFRIRGQTFTKELEQISKKDGKQNGFWIALDKKIMKLKNKLSQQQIIKYRLDIRNLRNKRDICFEVNLEQIKQKYKKQFQQLTANQEQNQHEDQRTINDRLSNVIHFGNSFVFPYKIRSIRQ